MNDRQSPRSPQSASSGDSGNPDDCPPPQKETTPRGRHDPILDPHGHGKDGTSRDARDRGNNGNPAQSAGRVSMREQNAVPERPGEPMP